MSRTRILFRKRFLGSAAVLFVVVPLAAKAAKVRQHPALVEPSSAAEPISPAVEAVPLGPVHADATACPSGMQLVEGSFCTNPKEECIDWVDDPEKFPYARCAKFKEPSTCAGDRIPMRFCMDKEEYTAADSDLPRGDTSWTDAKEVCESEGKRLCSESEWTFACEGEEMRPYPYGFERDPSACNFEQGHLVAADGSLRDGRVPVTANEKCVSPFGVHNMVGNIDEWVVLDKPHYSAKNGGRKMMSGLKGGWWGPLRNRCRPTTVDHDEQFHELQTGFRCCAAPAR